MPAQWPRCNTARLTGHACDLTVSSDEDESPRERHDEPEQRSQRRVAAIPTGTAATAPISLVDSDEEAPGAVEEPARERLRLLPNGRADTSIDSLLESVPIGPPLRTHKLLALSLNCHEWLQQERRRRLSIIASGGASRLSRLALEGLRGQCTRLNPSFDAASVEAAIKAELARRQIVADQSAADHSATMSVSSSEAERYPSTLCFTEHPVISPLDSKGVCELFSQ